MVFNTESIALLSKVMFERIFCTGQYLLTIPQDNKAPMNTRLIVARVRVLVINNVIILSFVRSCIDSLEMDVVSSEDLQDAKNQVT